MTLHELRLKEVEKLYLKFEYVDHKSVLEFFKALGLILYK